jgi:holo-[acyl-carrier protein] synthase
MITTEQILQQANKIPITGKSVVIGNDLVHLPAFVQSLNAQFKRRVYTNAELAYCDKFADSALRYASTWAAKEAVYKAIKQIDMSKRLWWCDIEILRAKAQGKPSVSITKIKAPLEFSLTITHDGDYAWAVAMCLYNKGVVL